MSLLDRILFSLKVEVCFEMKGLCSIRLIGKFTARAITPAEVHTHVTRLVSLMQAGAVFPGFAE